MNDFKISRKNSDLQEFVNAKYRRFAIKYGICAAIVLLAEVGFLFDAARSRLGVANAIALAAILFIAPFFIFGGHSLMFDKEWEGKVILFDYGTKMVSEGKKVGAKALGSRLRAKGGHSLVEYQYCDVYIEPENKKNVVHRIWMSPGYDKLPIEVGTRLRKYKGLPYPVILGNGKSECAVCGRVNDEDARECIDCRHSIIKTP